ncbi:MAG: adenylate/guanylate cyclase domain-containing protein, partial [Candidatus Delongbacteria bacterium]
MKKDYFKYLVISLVLSSVSLFTLLGFFDRFENQVYDLRFKSRYLHNTPEGSIKDIVVVDIDARSSQKLGKYFEWPRSYFAKAIDRLSESNASVTALDILFDKSRFSDQDSILESSIRDAGNVITGYSFAREDKENFIHADSSIIIPDNFSVIRSNENFTAGEFSIMDLGSDKIVRSSAAAGFLGIDSDEDGVIRKVRLVKKYKGVYLPSFAFAACLELQKADPSSIILSDGKYIQFVSGIDSSKIKIPLDSENRMHIHYRGPWRTFRTISFYDVMKRRVGKKSFRDKPVLIGSSLRGLMDLRATPVQRHFPGVEVQANIINTILSGDFICKNTKITVFLIMVLMIVLTAGLILSGLHISLSTLIIFVSGCGYFCLGNMLFETHNYVLDTTRPLFALIFSFLATYTLRYYYENRDKKFIRQTLGKYVPEVVSKEMLKDPSKLKVGGEKKEISMLFSDIRSFTSYSEKTDPEELVSFLNIYLKRMTGVVKKNQGTLDKYMGDAIICFFGAPLEIDHPFLSCRAALEMMKELSELKKDLDKDTFKNIDIGIGINTDTVTVGNIGSDDLFDYTAIGDGMNLASRLEGLNKYYGTNILISGSTQEKVKERFIFRELDEVYVKGKDEPVKMFELLSEADEQLSEEVTEKCGNYSEALRLYKSGNFPKARKIFEYLIEKFQDRSSVLMADRCSHLEKFPQHDWKGIWKMD